MTYDSAAQNFQMFIIVDGAKSNDIARLFSEYGLEAFSLFRSTSDKELLSSGPWLLPQLSNEVSRDIEALVKRVDGAVCWMGEGNQKIALRHFRLLNAALFPNGKMLFFRHYDPDVLASVVPLLDKRQAARLFGPFSRISFIGGRGTGQYVERPPNLSRNESGLIEFYSWQIDKLNERQEQIQRKEIVDFIRKQYPQRVSSVSANDLDTFVLSSYASGKSLGLQSERAFAQWCVLDFETDGRASENLEVLSASSSNMDDELDRRFDEIRKMCSAIS